MLRLQTHEKMDRNGYRSPAHTNCSHNGEMAIGRDNRNVLRSGMAAMEENPVGVIRRLQNKEDGIAS